MVDHHCPLPATHDKLDEAHFFLHGVLDMIHEPDPFRWNLNAFLQALRSVDHMLRVEVRGSTAESWYRDQRAAYVSDALLTRIKNGRDLVVHRGLLEVESSAHAGVFRGRVLKLALPLPLPTRERSSSLLVRFRKVVQEKGDPVFVDEDHSVIGEQYGIQRHWKVSALDPVDEVPEATHRAWARMHAIVAEAHRRLGSVLDPVPPEPEAAHDPRRWTVLLETDLDPSLWREWGWPTAEESRETLRRWLREANKAQATFAMEEGDSEAP